MNKLILIGAISFGVAAPAMAQPFTPIAPPVLAGTGYQYAQNDLAYSDKQDIYLLIQGHPFVGGRFVNSNGQLIGTQFDIARQSGSDADPRVAYSAGSADDVFLAIFRSELGGGTQVYGRLVMYSGGNPVLGPILGMTEISTPRPVRQVAGGIAFDPFKRQFFVTWEDWRFGLPKVFGRVWGLTGSGAGTTLVPVTGDFPIGNDVAGAPNIAYDWEHDCYLVVYRGPHPANGLIYGSFARRVTFPTAQPQISDVIVLTAGSGEPGEQNVIYMPEVDGFLTIWTDITGVRDVSGRTVHYLGFLGSSVYPILNTPSNEGAADLGYSPYTRTILLTAMRDQTRRIQGVQLTASGALTDSYFLASTALPAGTLETFFPNVAPAEGGRMGLSYVNDFTNGWVEVLQGTLASIPGPMPGGGTPPPPPPPPCAVEPLPTVPSMSLTGAAQSRSITVTASTADCPWTARSSVAWITITAGASGAGPGTTTFTVSLNTTGASRTGTVTVGSGSVAIQQSSAFGNAAVHDISGDRASDLMWHNEATGNVAVWTLVGSTVTSSYYLTTGGVDTNWDVVGTGDLNGDGFADIVWRHGPTGKLGCWTLQNGQIAMMMYLSENGGVAGESDPGWEVRAVGDLDGDGKSDIVWQHSSGVLAAWFMDGFTVRFRAVFNIGMPDANWKIAGAGDVNKDGKADILWQNDATGGLGVWTMDANQVIGQSSLSIDKVVDTNWKVRGVGDTNGDGSADILWQNTATGGLAVWYLINSTVVGTQWLSISQVTDPNWHVVGPG